MTHDTDLLDAASSLIARCKAKGEMIATAESCTGGLITGTLTGVDGSSSVVDCGFVTYSNEAKHHLIGVGNDLLAEYGAVSEPVARAMCEGALDRAPNATIAVSVTGIAGPGGGTEEKPVGLVHIAVAGPDGCLCQPIRLGETRGRDWVRTVSVGEALNRLRLRLMDAG